MLEFGCIFHSIISILAISRIEERMLHGLKLTAGILAALLCRERTGKGQEVSSSLYHSGVWTIAHDIQAALMGMPIPKNNRATATSPIYNSYRTKDDQWFQLTMP